MQGEHPHGTFHLHHAGWRLNWPFISVCADHLNNKQAVADPTVSDFNRTFYFRLLLTRACSEYVNEIAAANGPTHIVAPPLQENPAALLMRAAPPRRRAPAATCCPEPRLCRLQPASGRWSTRFA